MVHNISAPAGHWRCTALPKEYIVHLSPYQMVSSLVLTSIYSCLIELSMIKFNTKND